MYARPAIEVTLGHARDDDHRPVLQPRDLRGCPLEPAERRRRRVTVQQKLEAGRAGMNSESYRALMRHQAGAVTVIASGVDGSRAGLTATAVCSLSDNPPTILVCVQRRSGAHDLIAKARCFSVNLLSREQEDVAERFAGRRGVRGEARFAGLD